MRRHDEWMVEWTYEMRTVTYIKTKTFRTREEAERFRDYEQERLFQQSIEATHERNMATKVGFIVKPTSPAHIKGATK